MRNVVVDESGGEAGVREAGREAGVAGRENTAESAAVDPASKEEGAGGLAITITGAALGLILESGSGDSSSAAQTEFYEATKGCASVLCCRVSPKQKADVV